MLSYEALIAAREAAKVYPPGHSSDWKCIVGGREFY